MANSEKIMMNPNVRVETITNVFCEDCGWENIDVSELDAEFLAADHVCDKDEERIDSLG